MNLTTRGPISPGNRDQPIKKLFAEPQIQAHKLRGHT